MKNADNQFYKRLMLEIFANLSNQYSDNYSESRFGKRRKPSWKSRLKAAVKKKLGVKEYIKNSQLVAFNHLSSYFDGLACVYDTLTDEASKTLLIQVVTFRILGDRKYKLPLSTPAYFAGVRAIEALKDTSDYLKVTFVGQLIISLYRYDLNQIGIPLKMYYKASGLYSNIYIRQYEYRTEGVVVKPEEGDVVLDCGACWGDTALFFANDVGSGGHVYSFEFVKENVEMFNKNLELNPEHKKRITLVPYPLGEESGQEISFVKNGPGSRLIYDESLLGDQEKVKTISIDEFYVQYQPTKIDFIKMDIEGAELPALRGATSVLQKFRPKLAISLYHSMDDFVDIPKYLNSLELGYEFYLSHGTIYHEETVLIARLRR